MEVPKVNIAKHSWLIALATACLALSAGLVWAQSAGGELSLYREETVTTTKYPGNLEQTMTTRTWIKGDRMRTEAAEGNDVTIVRPDRGIVYTINAERRVYAETPLELYQRAARLSLMMLGADPAYRWTNRQQKIGAWQCREVILAEATSAHGDRLKTGWWVSEETGFGQATFSRIMRVTSGEDLGAEGEKFFQKLANIPGFPVRTESTFTRGGVTVKTVNTLVKLERREIEESRFDLPDGYTKVVIPTPGQM